MDRIPGPVDGGPGGSEGEGASVVLSFEDGTSSVFLDNAFKLSSAR